MQIMGFQAGIFSKKEFTMIIGGSVAASIVLFVAYMIEKLE